MPLAFHDGAQTSYPWLRPLLNPQENVDFAFNMALLGFLPWVVLALATNWRCRRRDWSGRARLGLAVLEYARDHPGAVPAVCRPAAVTACGPRTPTRIEIFPRSNSTSAGKQYGVYPPIPFGPTEIDLDARFEPPLFRKPADSWVEANDGFVHLLGTDKTGRDVLVQMLYGTRISMTVGFVAVGIYLAIGIVLGALAGYFGGKADMLDLAGDRGGDAVSLVVFDSDAGGPDRPQHLHHHGRDRDHGLAQHRPAGPGRSAKAAGDRIHAGGPGARFVELADRVSPYSAQCLVAGVGGGAVRHRQRHYHRSDLSLLGFGVEPPTPSWGTLLHQGHDNYHYWWLIVVPSVGIFLTVTLFNLVGSGLRDAMDPKLRASNRQAPRQLP